MNKLHCHFRGVCEEKLGSIRGTTSGRKALNRPFTVCGRDGDMSVDAIVLVKHIS